MEYAEIIFHEKRNPLTGNSFIARYEWQGSPYLPVKIERAFWKEAQHLLPCRLEVIDESWLYCYVVAIRTDVTIPSYAYYRFESDVLRLVDAMKWVGGSLVLTAQVWGLAYVPIGAYPSWQHLFCKSPYKF